MTTEAPHAPQAPAYQPVQPAGPTVTATQPMAARQASTHSPTAKAAVMSVAWPMVLKAAPVEAAYSPRAIQDIQAATATTPTAVKLIFSMTHPTAVLAGTPAPTTMVRWSAPAEPVHRAVLPATTTAIAMWTMAAKPR